VTVIASSGGLIVVAVFIVIIVAVAFGIFSRQGSEIDEHPLGGERNDGAPGAEGPGEMSGQNGDASSAFDQHGTR
jgi:cytochrome b